MSQLDDQHTEKEFSEAIDRLSSGKASGNENIPASVLKENKDIFYKSATFLFYAEEKE